MINPSDQPEVIPVDTHVHQIAMKYYGLRGSSKTKSNMTPQLYDEVNEKLAAVWGSYAGWAHSVSLIDESAFKHTDIFVRSSSRRTSKLSPHTDYPRQSPLPPLKDLESLRGVSRSSRRLSLLRHHRLRPRRDGG